MLFRSAGQDEVTLRSAFFCRPFAQEVDAQGATGKPVASVLDHASARLPFVIRNSLFDIRHSTFVWSGYCRTNKINRNRSAVDPANDSALCAECAIEILDQIVGVFQAHGNPNQAIFDSVQPAIRGVVARM